MNLYQINLQLQSLLDDALDTSTGELDEMMVSRARDLEMTREEMLLDIACLIKNYTAEALAHKAEAEVQAKKAKVCLNKVKRLQLYAMGNMEVKEKIKDSRVSLSKRSSTPSLKMSVKPEELDLDYQVLTVKADKKSITKLLRSGGKLDGCELVPTFALTIK